MTIHQSKGLEFDAVFLPDLDLQIKGRPPAFVLRTPDRTAAPTGVIRYFNKALRPYISEEWQQIFVEVSEHQLTEALCVFYVALTRARQALYLYTTAHSKPANRWGSVLQSILVSNPSERGESDRLLYRQGDEEWYRSAARRTYRKSYMMSKRSNPLKRSNHRSCPCNSIGSPPKNRHAIDLLASLRRQRKNGLSRSNKPWNPRGRSAPSLGRWSIDGLKRSGGSMISDGIAPK